MYQEATDERASSTLPGNSQCPPRPPPQGRDCKFHLFLKPRNTIRLLPKCSHFCFNQVQRASDFKTSVLTCVPTNQVSVCVDPRRASGGKSGRLPEGGEEKHCGWGSLSRKGFNSGLRWPRSQSTMFLKVSICIGVSWAGCSKRRSLSTPYPTHTKTEPLKLGGGQDGG